MSPVSAFAISKLDSRFEKPLLEILKRYFKEEGYSVSTHARLSIAWSNVISDVDVIARSRENEAIGLRT